MKKFIIVFGLLFLLCSCTSKNVDEQPLDSNVSHNNTNVSTGSYQQKETTSSSLVFDSSVMTEDEQSLDSNVSHNNTDISTGSYQQKETTSSSLFFDPSSMTESAETNEDAYDAEPQSDFAIAVMARNSYKESDDICSGEFLLYSGELYSYKFKNDEKSLINAINEAYRNNENIEYIKTIDETEVHDLYKMICTANYSEKNLRGSNTDSPEGEYMYVLSVCRKKTDGTTDIFPVTGNIDESCVDIYERFYEIYGES